MKFLTYNPEQAYLLPPSVREVLGMNAGAIIDQGAPRKRRFLAVQN